MFKLPSHSNLLTIDILYNSAFANTYISNDDTSILTTYKNTIDKKKYKSHWDKFKKLSNPYEFIHISKKKYNHNLSIAKYNPLSRSYFKLWEMIHKFKLLENLKNTSIKTAHVAEGPGGFMECLVNYRNAFKNEKVFDDVNGITLKSNTKYIPGWNKARSLIKKNNIYISYGKDGTGNIYNIDNIIHFSKKIGTRKCDLITSDGGFDFSNDFNHQEQLAYRLIFCELVITISNQKLGGHSVIKIFDMYTKLTVKLIYLITVLYEEVYIYKPLTSRPANSEKYIIAKNFKGIDETYLKTLYGIVRLWSSIESNNLYITDLFSEDIPDSFKTVLENYNKQFIEKQLFSIRCTLDLIDNKPSVKKYNSIVKTQVSNAISWCNDYNIEINKHCRYLNMSGK